MTGIPVQSQCLHGLKAGCKCVNISPHTDTRAEEQQKLLGGEGESGDEQPTATDPPPPVYTPPPPPPPPLSAVKPMGPPPEYTAQVPQYTPLPSMGYPVQLQVEGGHMVPATIVQDVSDRVLMFKSYLVINECFCPPLLSCGRLWSP